MDITGNKVVLRAIEEQDKEMFVDLIKDPQTAKATKGYSQPVSYDRQIRWFRSKTDSVNGVHRIIADREDPHAGLGIIILSIVDQEARSARICLKLMRAFRQKGYGEDAVAALVSYAFQELKLNHIYSHILEYNQASRRLFEKCGFQQEAVQKSRVNEDGRSRNVYVYGISCPLRLSKNGNPSMASRMS